MNVLSSFKIKLTNERLCLKNFGDRHNLKVNDPLLPPWSWRWLVWVSTKYSPQRIVFLKYYNQGMRKIALKTIFKSLNSVSQILIQKSAKVHFNFKNAGNETWLYLWLLKIIKFMLILGQVRSSNGWLCPQG